MLPIFPARAGTIPCQPVLPSITPGISCNLRGRSVDNSASPGTRKPWKRTGLNSMIKPVQLMSQPIAPVKNGMVAAATQLMSLDASGTVMRLRSSSLIVARAITHEDWERADVPG